MTQLEFGETLLTVDQRGKTALGRGWVLAVLLSMLLLLSL
jgi:hypothetical protein